MAVACFPREQTQKNGALFPAHRFYWQAMNYFFRSKRSSSITLVQAATKSLTSFS